METQTPRYFRFKSFELDLTSRQLLRNGLKQRLQGQPFELLAMFVERAGEVVTRDEIRHRLWPGDTFVDFEHGLNSTVRRLRDALSDSADNPKFIETLPRVGYRFIVHVEGFRDPARESSGLVHSPNGNGFIAADKATSELQTAKRESESDASDETAAKLVVVVNENKRLASRRLPWSIAAGAALGAGLTLAGWYLHRPLPPLRITSYTQLTHDGREKWPAGTDGSRVYFTQNYDTPVDQSTIAQVAISGGEIAAVPIGLPKIHFMEDISPDGSRLIIATGEKGALIDRPQYNVSVTGGSVHRLPDGSGATFSPDGQAVVYSTSDGGIWLVRSDGAGAHKLAAVESFAGGFSWSPDGKMIRFHRVGLLWEISSNGSNLHQLLSGWHLGDGQCCGRWTADGNFFLFRSGNLWLGSTQVWALDERRSMLRKPGEPFQLTDGPIRWVWLVPGKDPNKVYAEGLTPHGELSRYDAQAKAFRPFLGGISAGCVTFSRDGKFVAYVLYPEGTLWEANRDGSSPVQLSYSPIGAHNPRWSPDGKQIVFNDLAHIPPVIYTVSTGGQSPQRLLPEDKGGHGDPTWSPDGRRIVFSWSQSLDTIADAPEVRILDLGSRQVQTVPGSSGVSSPRWSPDGRYIAGIGLGQRGLKLFDIETQHWSTLMDSPLGYPSWSKDSRWIYFVAEDEDAIARIPVTGGKVQRVADLKDWTFTGWWDWMGLDPTDAPLMLRDKGSEDVYALTLQGK